MSKQFKTTRMPPTDCPECGKLLDGAAAPGSDAEPKAGDFSICFGCQFIHVFNEDLSLRAPTEEDLMDLPLDVVSRYQRILTGAKQQSH